MEGNLRMCLPGQVNHRHHPYQARISYTVSGPYRLCPSVPRTKPNQIPTISMNRAGFAGDSIS